MQDHSNEMKRDNCHTAGPRSSTNQEATAADMATAAATTAAAATTTAAATTAAAPGEQTVEESGTAAAAAAAAGKSTAAKPPPPAASHPAVAVAAADGAAIAADADVAAALRDSERPQGIPLEGSGGCGGGEGGPHSSSSDIYSKWGPPPPVEERGPPSKGSLLPPPVYHFHCPLCSFLSCSFSKVKSHAKETHPDSAADPKLAAASRGLHTPSFDPTGDYWVELGAPTEDSSPDIGAPIGAPHVGEGAPIAGPAATGPHTEGGNQEGGPPTIEASEQPDSGAPLTEPSGPPMNFNTGVGGPPQPKEVPQGAPREGFAEGPEDAGGGPPVCRKGPNPCLSDSPGAGAPGVSGGPSGGPLKSCLSGSSRSRAAAGAAGTADGGTDAQQQQPQQQEQQQEEQQQQQQQQQQQRRRHVAFGRRVRVRLVDKELSTMEQLGAIIGKAKTTEQ